MVIGQDLVDFLCTDLNYDRLHLKKNPPYQQITYIHIQRQYLSFLCLVTYIILSRAIYQTRAFFQVFSYELRYNTCSITIQII